jgi:hypothetical protein
MIDNDYEDREPIPQDATPEEIEEAAKYDMSVQSLRHVRVYEAERKANPSRVLPVIKLDRTYGNMIAADKDRGYRAQWQASGSTLTFDEWMAEKDADALAVAKVLQEADTLYREAKKIAADERKAMAEAAKALRVVERDRAKAIKAEADLLKDAIPVDYKGMFNALSTLFATSSDRRVGLLVELQAQQERTFELTVFQFMRLGDEWWDERFKKMVGHRATAIHKEMFGRTPWKRRMSKVRTPDDKLTSDNRNWVNMYPRGVIEQAFAQVVAKLTKAGTIAQYAVEPFRKVSPGWGEEIDEMNALLDAISEIYVEAQDEGRQIRSSDSKTNWGTWKGKRIEGLKHKLQSNEMHGSTWTKRLMAEALIERLHPKGETPDTPGPLEKPENTEGNG